MDKHIFLLMMKTLEIHVFFTPEKQNLCDCGWNKKICFLMGSLGAFF